MWSGGRKLWVSQIFCLSGSTAFKAVKPNQRKLCELFFRKQNSSERGHVQTVGNILLFSWVCIFCIIGIIDECVYKKKIKSKWNIGIGQIKMLCSPWNRRFFEFAMNSVKNKSRKPELGARGGRAALAHSFGVLGCVSGGCCCVSGGCCADTAQQGILFTPGSACSNKSSASLS